MVALPPLRWLACALAVLVLAVGCGRAAPPAERPPSLPAGYSLYDGGQLGFRFGRAPGWQRPGDPAHDGASFADPSRRGILLVHVGQAHSSDLGTATGAVMFDLTAGDGATGGSASDTRLAGRPARWVRGGFAAA